MSQIESIDLHSTELVVTIRYRCVRDRILAKGRDLRRRGTHAAGGSLHDTMIHFNERDVTQARHIAEFDRLFYQCLRTQNTTERSERHSREKAK